MAFTWGKAQIMPTLYEKEQARCANKLYYLSVGLSTLSNPANSEAFWVNKSGTLRSYLFKFCKHLNKIELSTVKFNQIT